MSDSRPPRWLLPIATMLVALSKLLLVKLRATTVLNILAGSRAGRRRRLDPEVAARSVAAAGGWLGADCLPRAIALATVLQREGQRPAVVLGSRYYGPGRWGAHAWVELDGKRFDAHNHHEGHTVLARLTASSRWEPRPPLPD